MLKIAKTLLFILLGAVVSLLVAVFSINETVMHLFAAVNVALAVLALIFAANDKLRTACVIALCPAPAATVILLCWVYVGNALHGERHWTEQVMLSDGKVVVVPRSEKGEWDIDKHLLRVHEERIEAGLPGARQVKWEGEGLSPAAIDTTGDGEVYLVATIESMQAERQYPLVGAEKPSPPGAARLVAFKSAGSGRWERIPLDQLPHLIQPNLLLDTRTYFDMTRHPIDQTIDLADKEIAASDPGLKALFDNWPKDQVQNPEASQP